MITIQEYPQQFELDGEVIEINQSMLRKITREKKEEKCSFEGNLVGYAYSEAANEYVVVVKYATGYYCISKQNGWFGPYNNIDEITFDEEKKLAKVKAESVLEQAL